MAVTFETVRALALALDLVQEGTSYGTPGFKVRGVLFARLHQSLDSLVLRADFEQRAELIAADSDTYYITDHYLNYEWVLVRLSQVHGVAIGGDAKAAVTTPEARPKSLTPAGLLSPGYFGCGTIRR
jgi:hypothetical protein